MQKSFVWIYNKGDDEISVDGVPANQIQILPNIGREAHTYLTHVIRHWDNLPMQVWFLQGNPFDHIEIKSDFETVQKWFGIWFDKIIHQGFSPNICEKFPLDQHDTCAGELTDMTFGPWLEKYTGKKYSSPLTWYIGACFGCSREQIQCRTREYYEGLLEQLQTKSPEAAWYMERAWFYIFNTEASMYEA
jgi:hypothetical protein